MIAALFLLGEWLTVMNTVGVGLIVAGEIVVNYAKSHWKLSRGHMYARLAAMLFGVAFTNDAYIINHYTSVAA